MKKEDQECGYCFLNWCITHFNLVVLVIMMAYQRQIQYSYSCKQTVYFQVVKLHSLILFPSYCSCMEGGIDFFDQLVSQFLDWMNTCTNEMSCKPRKFIELMIKKRGNRDLYSPIGMTYWTLRFWASPSNVTANFQCI